MREEPKTLLIISIDEKGTYYIKDTGVICKNETLEELLKILKKIKND